MSRQTSVFLRFPKVKSWMLFGLHYPARKTIWYLFYKITTVKQRLTLFKFLMKCATLTTIVIMFICDHDLPTWTQLTWPVSIPVVLILMIDNIDYCDLWHCILLRVLSCSCSCIYHINVNLNIMESQTQVPAWKSSVPCLLRLHSGRWWIIITRCIVTTRISPYDVEWMIAQLDSENITRFTNMW